MAQGSTRSSTISSRSQLTTARSSGNKKFRVIAWNSFRPSQAWFQWLVVHLLNLSESALWGNRIFITYKIRKLTCKNAIKLSTVSVKGTEESICFCLNTNKKKSNLHRSSTTFICQVQGQVACIHWTQSQVFLFTICSSGSWIWNWRRSILPNSINSIYLRVQIYLGLMSSLCLFQWAILCFRHGIEPSQSWSPEGSYSAMNQQLMRNRESTLLLEHTWVSFPWEQKTKIHSLLLNIWRMNPLAGGPEVHSVYERGAFYKETAHNYKIQN